MGENLSSQWHLVAKEIFGVVCYCFVFVGLEPRALCTLAKCCKSKPHPRTLRTPLVGCSAWIVRVVTTSKFTGYVFFLFILKQFCSIAEVGLEFTM